MTVYIILKSLTSTNTPPPPPLYAKYRPPRDFAALQFPEDFLYRVERARRHLAMNGPVCPHRQNLAEVFPRPHGGCLDLNLASRHQNRWKRDIVRRQPHHQQRPRRPHTIERHVVRGLGRRSDEGNVYAAGAAYFLHHVARRGIERPGRA